MQQSLQQQQQQQMQQQQQQQQQQQFIDNQQSQQQPDQNLANQQPQQDMSQTNIQGQKGHLANQSEQKVTHLEKNASDQNHKLQFKPNNDEKGLNLKQDLVTKAPQNQSNILVNNANENNKEEQKSSIDSSKQPADENKNKLPPREEHHLQLKPPDHHEQQQNDVKNNKLSDSAGPVHQVPPPKPPHGDGRHARAVEGSDHVQMQQESAHQIKKPGWWWGIVLKSFSYHSSEYKS